MTMTHMQYFEQNMEDKMAASAKRRAGLVPTGPTGRYFNTDNGEKMQATHKVSSTNTTTINNGGMAMMNMDHKMAAARRRAGLTYHAKPHGYQEVVPTASRTS